MSGRRRSGDSSATDWDVGCELAGRVKPLSHNPMHMRRQWSAIIALSAHRLKFGHCAARSAMLLFQRFWSAVGPRARVHPSGVSAGALLVASKAEGAHRRPRDIVNTVYAVCHPDAPPLGLDSLYRRLKALLLAHETVVVRALAFDVLTQHPLPFLLQLCAKCIATKRETSLATALVNQGYRTDALVRWSASRAAAGALWCAVDVLRLPSSVLWKCSSAGDGEAREGAWWRAAGVHNEAMLAAICEDLLLACEPFELQWDSEALEGQTSRRERVDGDDGDVDNKRRRVSNAQEEDMRRGDEMNE